MPAEVDSNSPAFWKDGEFHLLNSTGAGPVRSSGNDQFNLGAPTRVPFRTIATWPAWIEAVWVDPSGVIFGWYHQEDWGVCPGTRLSSPSIGAAVSFDGGASFQDMGIMLTSGGANDCRAANGYFAGGVGDFSVVLGRDRYFYFLFSNYAGPVNEQGVAVARLPYQDRWWPAVGIRKYYRGDWTQPGLRGRVTPIFPAKVSWQSWNTDSFWGPSVHWNTYLQRYVMLLNRSCCAPGWPQESIYIRYSADLRNPESWSAPEVLLNDTGWYPQVLGYGNRGTDREAGRVARLYISGHSYRDIVFERPPRPGLPPESPVESVDSEPSPQRQRRN